MNIGDGTSVPARPMNLTPEVAFERFRERLLSVIYLRMGPELRARMDPEANAALLVGAATDLSDVFVFPNPFLAAEASRQRVVIAGLPPEADATVYTLLGQRVRQLAERDGDGGLPWDLSDESGAPVPSGTYFVRVESPSGDPVIVKVALIR